MNHKVEVAIIGSCNVDHITYTSRLPIPGETLYGKAYEKGLGGKGANQCVAVSKLGARAAMIGKVGQDGDGDSYLREFRSLNVNVDCLNQIDIAATGIATIVVDDAGNNSIIIVPGANLQLEPSDIKHAQSIIESASVVVCQNEIPLETTLFALQTARNLGKMTIFNVAPAPLQELDEKFFTLSDVMCVNESEAFTLVNIKVNSVDDGRVAALKLVEKGCEIAVVTLGENGCVYAEKGKSETEHIERYKVNVVDTTGAGDCLLGALAFYLVRFPQIPLREKLKRACYVASVCVTKKGTQRSYPFGDELNPAIFSPQNFNI